MYQYCLLSVILNAELSKAMRLLAEKVLLSEREAQIAALISGPGGMTSPAIGRRLGITENTVKIHLKRIYRALEITTRSELVRWCLQHPRALSHREPSHWRTHPEGCECVTLPWCMEQRRAA